MPDRLRPSVDDVMAQARRQFVNAARGTLDAFEQFGRQLGARPDAGELLTELRRELHRLNGSAGTFGFPRIGRMAAALESAVKRWASDSHLDRDRRAQIVSRFARALRHELAGDGTVPSLAVRRMLLVGLTDAVAVPLTTEASARGFQVECAGSAELEEALADGMPHAIIAWDTVLGLGNLRGVARLALRRREPGEITGPMVGGVRTLDARTEPREVLDAIEAVAERERADGGRVIAVDDDPVMRTIVQAACEHMNLAVSAVADAPAFLAALRDTKPALFVIDIDLGASSGLDLVRAARAMPVTRTPILVLSGHADVATRDAALVAGADDYMLKPFVPAEFQRRVQALLEVARRRLADTGTHAVSGLALPSRTTEEFDAELATRPRDDTSLGVIGPLEPPGSMPERAAWHAECARLAGAVREADGIAGLLDDLTVGVIRRCTAATLRTWIETRCGQSAPGAPRCAAGVIGAGVKGADASLATLVAGAREARQAAIERGVMAREWDPSDADMAPDVVIVEDDAVLAGLIVFALTTRGLSHRHFADGLSALDALRAMRVRAVRPIVLLDVDLPGLDGHSLHDRLRVELAGRFDVVFLSGKASEVDQLRALQAGALDYVVKPVSLRVLITKLAAWSARRTAL